MSNIKNIKNIKEHTRTRSKQVKHKQNKPPPVVMSAINITLPPDLLAMLLQLCKETMRSKTAELRHALLVAYEKKHGKAKTKQLRDELNPHRQGLGVLIKE